MEKPENVLGIFDCNNGSLDRYTVVLAGEFDTKITAGYYDCLCLSEDPTAPLGFSQMSQCMSGEHLGKEILFEDLSEDLQKHIIYRVVED